MIGPWVILMLACHSWPGSGGVLPSETSFLNSQGHSAIQVGEMHAPATSNGPTMIYPMVCLNPFRTDGLRVRHCGDETQLGMGWFFVLDWSSCKHPYELLPSDPRYIGCPRDWWTAKGHDRWVADWDGPLDPDRDGDWDVDDIQTVIWAIEGAELPGPRLGDVCPVICSDGTIDIQDLMAVIWGFEGHFECGW